MKRSTKSFLGLFSLSTLLFSCAQPGPTFKQVTPETVPAATNFNSESAPAEPSLLASNPYDLFVQKNQLPSPNSGESNADFSQRYKEALLSKTSLVFISPEDHSSTKNNENFSFGTLELQGLTIFLSSPYNEFPDQDELAYGGIGQCYTCHAPHQFNTANSPHQLRQTSLATLTNHLKSYQQKAASARASKLKNNYRKIALTDSDITALSAFIQTLNQKITP
ncbi:MAG: hypothetical protein HOM11_02380 [Methylococcales bacterium]|jgi:cytochrome c553|nr:hypothetical protein [Methylococcales bacterium]MBT7444530.1 hypothetical protein [Methylococcales bacterium]